MNKSQVASVSSQERSNAAIAHLGVVIPYVGILVPLIIYVTQRRVSKFVEFQSLQALIYRFALMVFPFVLVSSFILLLAVGFAALALLEGSISANAYGAATELLSFLWRVSPLVGLLILFIILVMVAIGLAGAVKVYSGDDFNYPLFAAVARRFIADDQ